MKQHTWNQWFTGHRICDSKITQDYRMFEFSNLNINIHLQHDMALQLFISRQIKMFQLILSVSHT